MFQEFTPDEWAEGLAFGRKAATAQGCPQFIYHDPKHPWSPWCSAYKALAAPTPEAFDDDPQGGKLVAPRRMLGWVHPDWEKVTFSGLELVCHMVWTMDVPADTRLAWGAHARTLRPNARTEYLRRKIRAGGTNLEYIIGVCRAPMQDLTPYPPAPLTPPATLITATA